MSAEPTALLNIGRERLLVDPESFQRMFFEHGAIMYVVDLESFHVIDANKAALDFYGYDRETMLTKRVPDLNTAQEEEIRDEIQRAVAEGRSYYIFKHRLADGEIRDVEVYANPVTIQGKTYSFSVVHDITERMKAEEDRDRLISELKQAATEIKTLRGIIPVCAGCKKIRDDEGGWNQMEEYVSKHSHATFSHGFCPDCLAKQYHSAGLEPPQSREP